MTASLLSLLHLCDSLFPLGAFAHSDGLEAAVHAGLVSNAADLDAWLTACLDEVIGRGEGPAVAAAWTAARAGDWEAIARLDRDLVAMRPAAESRAAMRTMGRRLIATWQTIHGGSASSGSALLDAHGGAALPVAFGIAAASAGIDRHSAGEGYAYTRLAASVSAAMRLMSIGQIEAHTLLARIRRRIPAVVDELERRGALPESFTPMLDIMTMTHRAVHSRLFRS
ncbi:MAG TPA: urease accessory UreF family protein [Vicinamibacterales bacterium]|nr:urease accessory UreF family protein [Vicinamibacterales bacterium]